MSGELYWLAINGPSVAASSVSMPSTVRVSPTPEQLIGFKTRDEQRRVQSVLLTKPINRVNAFMQSLATRIESGDIVYIRPDNPQPPTRGQTLWMVQPEPDGPFVEQVTLSKVDAPTLREGNTRHEVNRV